MIQSRPPFPYLGRSNGLCRETLGESLFNAFGARTRLSYLSPQWFDELNYITADEQMFEWITIVETILAAEDYYVMVDLGAGYGRWLVNAALLARRFKRVPFVIGVEAEDTHFCWMKEHLNDNQIAPVEQRLIHAPITGQRRDVPFTIGHANDWYGQAVLPSADTGFGHWPNAHVEMRPSIILQDVIGDTPLSIFSISTSKDGSRSRAIFDRAYREASDANSHRHAQPPNRRHTA